jgi:hypothetical protein
MKQLSVTTLLIIFVLSAGAKNIIAKITFQDTINDLSVLKKRAVYKAPDGKTYNVSFEADEQTRVTKMKTVTRRNARGVTRRRAVANANCDNNNKFDGSYRKVAKLSIAKHNARSTSLIKLINRLVAMDNAAIDVNSTSPRIAIEDSVVTLLSVYLYAIARETDEDYHIIIGTSANPATAKFFNIECSGLPPTNNPAYSKIKAARDKVVALLGGTERCTSGYIKFNDHPKVKIIGSLFYDKGHSGSLPGPASSKPKTAWELHPITEFKML